MIKQTVSFMCLFALTFVALPANADPGTSTVPVRPLQGGPGSPGSSYSEREDDVGGAPGIGKGVTVDKIIAAMKARKDRIIAANRARFERLPERLAKSDERVDRFMNRQKKGEGKVASDGAKTSVGTHSAELKARMTEKYNKFKTMLSEKKSKIAARFDERRTRIQQKIGHLKPEEQAKVMAEFESDQKEVVDTIGKLIDEAMTKLDATYKDVITKLG
ncbi:MAG: hypothetical protein HQM09_11755 [Candidatus Riflebacteria bacterium]|nr:hypothetical protein [Candidatus Riflebacteria bacterium]